MFYFSIAGQITTVLSALIILAVAKAVKDLPVPVSDKSHAALNLRIHLASFLELLH